MDPFTALMGSVPTEEQQRRMAEVLRGQAITGGRLSTSTIAPVAKQGQALQGMAQDAATGIGTANYRNRMMDEYEKNREASILKAAMAARAKAAGEGQKEYKLSDTAAKRFEDRVEIAGTVRALANEFQDDFAGTIPFFGEVENFFTNRGIATEGMRKQAQWWGDWRKHYENIERNRLFGSALTESEQRAWKASNITPDMSPEDIKARLATLDKLSAKAVAYYAKNLKNRNINPDYVEGVVDAYGFSDESQDPASPQYGLEGVYTRGDLSTLSDEELQSLYQRMRNQ